MNLVNQRTELVLLKFFSVGRKHSESVSQSSKEPCHDFPTRGRRREAVKVLTKVELIRGEMFVDRFSMLHRARSSTRKSERAPFEDAKGYSTFSSRVPASYRRYLPDTASIPPPPGSERDFNKNGSYRLNGSRREKEDERNNVENTGHSD